MCVCVCRADQIARPLVKDGEDYVLKRCKDYGEAEIWTNSRLMRACPNNIASYRGAFYAPMQKKAKKLPSEAGGGHQRDTRNFLIKHSPLDVKRRLN